MENQTKTKNFTREFKAAKEEFHLNDYEDIHDARVHIGHFITHMYHHKRPHSALGNHLTRAEFEQQNLS